MLVFIEGESISVSAALKTERNIQFLLKSMNNWNFHHFKQLFFWNGKLKKNSMTNSNKAVDIFKTERMLS